MMRLSTINLMNDSGRDELVRKIKELSEEEACRLCAHTAVDIVLNSHGRVLYEVCRSCGKRLNSV